MTAQDIARSIGAMNTGKTYQWTGLGRWLALAAAAGMILFSIPLIVSNVAAGGWNVFLGLLLFGVTVSGNRHAPKLAYVLAILFAIRAVLAVLLEADFIGAAIEAVFCAVIAVSASRLDHQKADADRA
ncbi:hypothetical protein [Sphingomonas sp.]|uniref:hypothetical protein n=1 Tax=Sphingomonas sp. TaxID=28214 RepID=UPI002E0FC76E|nr:hypothetical protein [Sphingomonas sp.]